tara:strand:- start:54552 stop:54770 length:219 start_codon:yes stop_codon:yes gene_type:complete
VDAPEGHSVNRAAAGTTAADSSRNSRTITPFRQSGLATASNQLLARQSGDEPDGVWVDVTGTHEADVMRLGW